MGFVLFIRSDIPAKVVFTDGERFESLSVELNFLLELY